MNLKNDVHNFLETLNIEWGRIDPKGNRRVKENELTYIMMRKAVKRKPPHINVIT